MLWREACLHRKLELNITVRLTTTTKQAMNRSNNHDQHRERDVMRVHRKSNHETRRGIELMLRASLSIFSHYHYTLRVPSTKDDTNGSERAALG